MSNYYAKLDRVFSEFSNNDVLRMLDGSAWQYAQLQNLVGEIGYVLQQQGVTPGDRVVVQVAKSPQNLALYLATLRIGAVYVPLNTGYTQAELDYFVDDAKPALFVGAQVRADVTSLTLQGDGSGSLIDAIVGGEQSEIIDRENNDLAAILYTSGTTGRSKGAMLSHHNLASNADDLCTAWGWQGEDVLLHALPIFHVHGLFIASHCALQNGSTMYWLNKFDVAEVEQALPHCSVMMGVPTFYTRLLAEQEFPRFSLDHVRVFICGSAPLTEQTFDSWEQRTGHRILERYGMSETIINTTNPLNGQRVPATVGFALPNLELRIADADGKSLGSGEIGTIEVRGPNVFSGYWQMPEKTAEEIRSDGFFITGDLGTQDEEGRVSIVGRGKDLVISGGYNVYPKEVERLIDEVPGVLESAVIGVPHDDFGEGVVAIVVPQDVEIEISTELVTQFLATQLAKFKQPKVVVNVAELPRNTMGKVQKNLLR